VQPPGAEDKGKHQEWMAAEAHTAALFRSMLAGGAPEHVRRPGAALPSPGLVGEYLLCLLELGGLEDLVTHPEILVSRGACTSAVPPARGTASIAAARFTKLLCSSVAPPCRPAMPVASAAAS
jgi:hypothetical protein